MVKLLSATFRGLNGGADENSKWIGNAFGIPGYSWLDLRGRIRRLLRGAANRPLMVNLAALTSIARIADHLSTARTGPRLSAMSPMLAPKSLNANPAARLLRRGRTVRAGDAPARDVRTVQALTRQDQRCPEIRLSFYGSQT